MKTTPSHRSILRSLLAAFLVALVAPMPARATEGLQTFLGWMPMQPVLPGQTLIIDMHRFYFRPPTSTERLILPDEVPGLSQLGYEAGPRRLLLQVDKSASGLIEVPLQIYSSEARGGGDLGRKDMAQGVESPEDTERVVAEGLLLLAVQPDEGFTFRYTPPSGQRVESVNVAGSFNGWNTGSHQLQPVQGGAFELFVPMGPGTHTYKLVVDGEWILDPANPERLDDGTGNENSIARVGVSDRGAPPVAYATEAGDGSVTFRIVEGGSAIGQISTVLQLPDGHSRTVEHERDGDSVTVTEVGAPEGSWVRLVAADAKGNISMAARAPLRTPKVFQWQDGIMYYAFTDRFADGDPSNNRPVDDDRVLPPANYQGGDFQGIRRKIDEGYFRDLGVNILWLAPINRNPDGAWQEHVPPYRFYTGYHGYWPVSHTEVEPRFGGEAALKSMISTAHQNDIFIIADLVLKHVHQDHPMWTEQRELFGTLELPDGTKNLRRWDDHQFTTWFEEWLPGFDFTNAEAVKFLIANAIDFAKRFNLDGYRLDAVKHIERDFWWKYRTAMRSAVDPGREVPLYSVGETFMDREGIMSFVGPNMLDGQFDFPLYDTLIDVFAKGHQGMDELENSLSASELIYGKETLMSPLVGNHDKPRFMAYADGDLPDPNEPDEIEVGYNNPPQVDNATSYDKLKLALTFVLSIDGVPMIYYGDEIGMTGAGDPDNRRFMQWEDIATEQEAVREHFSKVAAVRHQHPALRYGSRRALVAEGDRYAFVRAHLGDSVLAVWNRGDRNTEFSLRVGPEMPDGSYADALSGQVIEVKDGRTTFKMDPMKSALFVAKATE